MEFNQVNQRSQLNIHRIYESDPKDFPDIPQDHFQLKDQQTIKELKKLLIESQQQTPASQYPLQYNEQIDKESKIIERTQSVFQEMEKVQKPFFHYQIDNDKEGVAEWNKELETNLTYYSMEGTQYDDSKTLGSAFEFLKNLEKSKQEVPTKENDDMASEIEQISISSKPQYQGRKINQEQKNEDMQLIKQKIQMLSIYDEI